MLQISLEATLGFHLIVNVLSRELSAHVGRCASYLGMSEVELMSLYVVQKLGRATAGEVVRALAYREQDIAAALDKLAQAELVVEIVEDDGCCCWASTKLGEEIIARLSGCRSLALAVGQLEAERLAQRVREALTGLEF